MTVLESYSDRQNIGIDSFERALLYSAILLNKANIDPNNFVPASSNPNFTAVELNINISDGTTSQITGKVNLTYANFIVLEDGINHFDNIDVFGFTNPNPLNILCPKSDARFMELIPEPNDITTVERYFYWLAIKIKYDLVKFQPDVSQLIKIKFNPRFKDTVGRVVIEFALPISTTKYLSNYNVLCSVEPLLRFPVTLVAKANSIIIHTTNITIREIILRIYNDFSSTVSNTAISSKFRYLKIIRNNLINFVRISTVASKGSKTTVEKSEFNRLTTVNRFKILNKLSKLNVATTIDVIKSRSNPVRQTSTPEYITEITSNEQILKTDLLVGGWQAKVTIEIKPDLIEADLFDYPLFIHPEDIRNVFDLVVGKKPNVGTLQVWGNSDLTQSFRVKQSNGELLPIYTATGHTKPNGAGYQAYTPDYYYGGIWILLPYLSSIESTFIDLYFLDLFQDNETGTFGSNKTYPLNRANVFNQYHWWSFYTTEETGDDPLSVNLGTATIATQQDFGTNNNENSANKRYDLATNSNTNNHPFTVQSANFLSFVDLAQGELTTNPINLTPELTTPTLQTWQIGETFTAVEFGNLVLTSGDVTKASVNNEDSRKISLTQDGGYFNDTFHNPRTIASETTGSSPELRLGVGTDFSNFYLYNQIKLHKQQLSFEWIKTEYNNEINRSQFYDVKQVKYISAFNQITEISSSDSIFSPLIEYSNKLDSLNVANHFVLDEPSGNFVDRISGGLLYPSNTNLIYQSSNIKKLGDSVELDGSLNLADNDSNISLSTNGDWSLSVWIKLFSFGGQIFRKGNAFNGGWDLRIKSNGTLILWDDNFSILGIATLSINQPFFLVWTYDGLNYNFYKDGALTLSRQQSRLDGYPVNFLLANAVNGQLNNFTKHDSILTDQEILELYNIGIQN